jgi:hypothetical protein
LIVAQENGDAGILPGDTTDSDQEVNVFWSISNVS